jgi:L-arabinose isomerase
MSHLADLAEMAGIEFVAIDERTETRELKQQLRWSQAYYRLLAP